MYMYLYSIKMAMGYMEVLTCSLPSTIPAPLGTNLTRTNIALVPALFYQYYHTEYYPILDY